MHQKHTRIFFLLFVFVFTQYKSFSQTEKIQIIDVSLGQDKFLDSNFPFDEPFYIRGTIPGDGCNKIVFTYDLKEPPKNGWWKVFPPDNFSSTWNRQSKDEKQFIVYCPGLHPGKKYNFQFTVLSSIPKETADALKISLFKAYLDIFKNFVGLDVAGTEIIRINTELDKVLKKELAPLSNTTLRQKDNPGSNYSVDLTSSDWGGVFAVFNISTTKIKVAKDKIFSSGGSIESLKNMFTLVAPLIQKDITTVNSKPSKIDDLSSIHLKSHVNSFLTNFESYTIDDGLSILSDLSTTPQLFEGILSGKNRISKNAIVPSDSIDFNSVFFLQSLMNKLYKGSLSIVSAGTTSPLFTCIDKAFINEFNADAAFYEEVRLHSYRINNYKTNFPDFTTKIISATVSSSDVITIADVSTEKTPYISAEAGLGYAPFFNQAFNYVGANFYFAPVNKKTRLCSYKNTRYALSKAFCINLGYINYFGDRPTNTYSILGKNAKADLSIGLGLRLGRIIKVNCNWVPYKSNNNSPLSETYTYNSMVVFMVGLDINIIKALGDLSKVLTGI